MGAAKGKVNLPFGIVGRGEARFPQELSEDELGNGCPLACPACFAPLRGARVSAYDDGAGVKLTHRPGAGECKGIEQSHMAAAYAHAAETLSGKFFWTPERHEGDWSPHAAAEGGPVIAGHQRLYLVTKALTGKAARAAARGAEGIDAVLSLSSVEGGRTVRRVALRFANGDGLDAVGARSAAETSGMGVIEVECSPAGDLDPVFGLSQLQDELTGQGSAKADRHWLYDDRCGEPVAEAETEPEPVPESIPEACEEQPQPSKRGFVALVAKLFRR